MQIRKAAAKDIRAVAAIYEQIHKREEAGLVTIGWQSGVYPIAATARAALQRDDLYVMEDEGRIVASAIINQVQVPEYANARWMESADPADVLVLHTLTVCPTAARRGCGRRFVAFYEEEARRRGIHHLRMDTNARNVVARQMYAQLGYVEADIVPCVFNGIPGVQLVCLEKEV